MLECIKGLLGVSESRYSVTRDEKIESLKIAEVAFFASLREEIECFNDLIDITDSPEVLDIIEEHLDKGGYDYSLPQNGKYIRGFF